MYVAKPPYFLYDNDRFSTHVFFDPVDAMEFIVQLGPRKYGSYDLLDSKGTTIHFKDLERSFENMDKLNDKPNKYAVDIHTDGACSGNPGPGGWCGIVVMYSKGRKLEKTVKGYSLGTTNNAMELTAVVEALKTLRLPCEVTVHTDSQYLCTCSKHSSEWFDQPNRPNKDLWIEYLKVCCAGRHHVTFEKVKGHSGEEYNERCDRNAKEQVKKAFHKIYEQGKNLIY